MDGNFKWFIFHQVKGKYFLSNIFRGVTVISEEADRVKNTEFCTLLKKKNPMFPDPVGVLVLLILIATGNSKPHVKLNGNGEEERWSWGCIWPEQATSGKTGPIIFPGDGAGMSVTRERNGMRVWGTKGIHSPYSVPGTMDGVRRTVSVWLQFITDWYAQRHSGLGLCPPSHCSLGGWSSIWCLLGGCGTSPSIRAIAEKAVGHKMASSGLHLHYQAPHIPAPIWNESSGKPLGLFF